MLIPVLPLYLTDVGVSLELAGVVLGATGIGAALGGLPAGAAMARVSENTALVGALVLIAISTALLGLTAGALALVVLRAATGAGRATLRLSRQTYVTRRVDDSIRGRALANMGGSIRVSMLIGPVLGGVLVDQVGFETTFLVAGLFAMVGLLPLLASKDDFGIPRERGRARRGLLRALNDHRRLLGKIAVVPFLIVASREARQVVFPLIGDDLALSASAIGVLIAATSVADLLLFPLAGYLMDRFGRLWGMTPSFVLMGLGHIALGLAWGRGSVFLVVLAGIGIGIGNGLSAGSLLTLGSDVAPEDAAPEFLAGLGTLQEGGRVVGPLMVGVVGAGISLGAAAFAIALLLFVAAVWVTFVIGETKSVMRSSR